MADKAELARQNLRLLCGCERPLWVRSGHWTVAAMASQALLDRAWGKSREFADERPVEHGKTPDLRRLTLGEQGIFLRLLDKTLTDSSDPYPNRMEEVRRIMDST